MKHNSRSVSDFEVGKKKISRKAHNETDYFFFHDVNRMLRLVVNFSALLKKNNAVTNDDDAFKIVNFLGKVSNQMQELISFFLFKKTGNQKLYCGEIIDLSNIICDSWCKTYALNRHEKPKLCINSKSCKIKGNTSFLQQVFMNLFENSIRYKSEDNPKVKIDIKEEKGHVKVRITDNGIGVRSSELEKIFMPQYRSLKSSHKRGHGLGLALSKQIIKLHNGDIWAEDHAQKGACFVLELPSA